MMASSLAGGIWLMFGAPATFMFSAIATVLTIAYMIVVVPSRSHHQV
jgi:hypothetical protein